MGRTRRKALMIALRQKWSAINKAAALALSGAGLTLTHDGADSFAAALGLRPIQGGETYSLDVGNGAGDGMGIGIGNASMSLSGYVGSDNNGAAYLAGGQVRRNGGDLATGLSTWGATSDQVFLQMSLDGLQFRFKKGAGGSWSSWITHGVSGPVFPATYLFFANNETTATFL